MAAASDAERSLAATPKRIEKAREEGRVARSRELAAAAIMLGAALFVWGAGPSMMLHLRQVLTQALVFDRDSALDPALLLPRLHHLSYEALLATLPLMGVLMAVTIAAPLLLSGWNFSLDAFRPNFSRLNPLSGLQKMVSGASAVELAKTIAKCLLLGGIAGVSLWRGKAELIALCNLGVIDGMAGATRLVTSNFFWVIGGLVVVALIDAPYQVWQYRDSLKMSREEMRQEMKEENGDPQLKARLRSQQRAIARKRMMAQVPKADVIVTNPTHFAVALEYREGAMRAPRVLAKGAELIAQKIRELGEANGIPIVESPPLARALFRHSEIGQEIPQPLYNAVAQVLAYVFQLRAYRGRGAAPQAPRDLPVPPGLDPLGLTQGADA